MRTLVGYEQAWPAGPFVLQPRGFVYIVQEEGGGFVKIGRTADLSSRIRALEANAPRTLIILAVLRETDDLERELHYRFVHSRAQGEWYHPAFALLDFASEHYDVDVILEALSPDEREGVIWPA